MKFVVKSVPSVLFLFVGLLIVLLSFISANTVFSQGKSLQLTQKKMYLAQEVLPDHILYPVFMAFDRVKLALTRPEDRALVNLDYSWQRLIATEELLKKGYQGLSFSTLTKACKYQNSGLIEAVNLDREAKEKVIFQANQFKTKVNDFRASFSDEQQRELEQLIQEQTAILANLK